MNHLSEIKDKINQLAQQAKKADNYKIQYQKALDERNELIDKLNKTITNLESLMNKIKQI